MNEAEQETLDAVIRRIRDLNEQSLLQLSQYVGYLKWQEELWHSLMEEEGAGDDEFVLVWQCDLLEAFPESRQSATRTSDLMEVRLDTASCGLVQRPALWQHPPVEGSAVVEYELRVPAEVDRLRLRFAIGIRDGAQMQDDNFCAFRVLLNGVRVWSDTKQTCSWERFVADLPNQAGQPAVLQLMTDGLGNSRWNWAVWAEPQLLGYAANRAQ
ncbi:MAG: hypothetical protein OXL39_14690 [Caldilineaceae bacterium]|nr:hypothetical protein [Caldilineaceae bacterium]MDE0068844.1 hypothetical protein [Caldilineaceae bacterium]MDE0182594.1 hypothetical protein [Caldilineaceae bacterium]MDE0428747.1 hypothetical protein [Caldilineaceae bacterium]